MIQGLQLCPGHAELAASRRSWLCWQVNVPASHEAGAPKRHPPFQKVGSCWVLSKVSRLGKWMILRHSAQARVGCSNDCKN